MRAGLARNSCDSPFNPSRWPSAATASTLPFVGESTLLQTTTITVKSGTSVRQRRAYGEIATKPALSL